MAKTATPRYRNHNAFTAGAEHPFMPLLTRFCFNGSPVAAQSIRGSFSKGILGHQIDLETLAAGLYFVQVANPKLGYAVGIRLAEYMLPKCTYVSQDGQHQVADRRAAKLIRLVKAYGKSGGIDNLRAAEGAAARLDAIKHETPRTYNRLALQVVTNLGRHVGNYNLVGTAAIAMEAMDTTEEVEKLVAFLKETLELGLKQMWDPEVWGQSLIA